MAEDIVVLLDFLGWTGRRELHVVGVSLGGMVSQGSPLRKCSLDDAEHWPELATLISERFVHVPALPAF